MRNVPPQDACQFVIDHADVCQTQAGFLNYLHLRYCVWQHWPRAFLAGLAAWSLVLLWVTVVVAGHFFAPAVELLAEKLALPPNVAGATLLAFGNGANDVFTQLAAVEQMDAASLPTAVSESIGGGLMVTNVVLGAVVLLSAVHPVRVEPGPFLRDTLFYLGGVVLLFAFLLDGKVLLIEAISLAVYYALYVAFVFTSTHGQAPVVLDHSAEDAHCDDVDTVMSILNPQSPRTLTTYTPWTGTSRRAQSLPVTNAPAVLPSYLDTSRRAQSVMLPLPGPGFPTTNYSSLQQQPASPSLPMTPKSGLEEAGAPLAVLPSPFEAAQHAQQAQQAQQGSASLQASETEAPPQMQPQLRMHRGLTSHPVTLTPQASMATTRSGSGSLDLPRIAAERLRAQQLYRMESGVAGVPDRPSRLSVSSAPAPAPPSLGSGPQSASPSLGSGPQSSPPSPAGSAGWHTPSAAPQPAGIAEGDGELTEPLLSGSHDELGAATLLELPEQVGVSQCSHKGGHRSLLGRALCLLLRVLEAPFVVILRLTMPQVNAGVRYPKIYALLLPFLTPLFWLYTTRQTLPLDPKHPSAAIYGFTLALFSSGLMWSAYPARGTSAGPFQGVFAVMTFVVSMQWLNVVCGELVAVVAAAGHILGVRRTLLAATVLGWGNSLNDLVANAALAAAGFPTMAFAACFAGPMFNMLIGMSFSLIVRTISYGPVTNFHVSNAMIVMFVGHLALLARLIVTVPCLGGWKLTRVNAVLGLLGYAGVLTVYILASTGVIFTNPWWDLVPAGTPLA